MVATPFLLRASCPQTCFHFSHCFHACCSVMSDSATPWTVAHQAPLSVGFFQARYWSGLPFPCPGDLPDSGIGPVSPALAGGLFTTKQPGKSNHCFKPHQRQHAVRDLLSGGQGPQPHPGCPRHWELQGTQPVVCGVRLDDTGIENPSGLALKGKLGVQSLTHRKHGVHVSGFGAMITRAADGGGGGVSWFQNRNASESYMQVPSDFGDPENTHVCM